MILLPNWTDDRCVITITLILTQYRHLFFNSFRYFTGYLKNFIFSRPPSVISNDTLFLLPGLNAGIVLRVGNIWLSCLPISHYFIFDRIRSYCNYFEIKNYGHLTTKRLLRLRDRKVSQFFDSFCSLIVYLHCFQNYQDHVWNDCRLKIQCFHSRVKTGKFDKSRPKTYSYYYCASSFLFTY